MTVPEVMAITYCYLFVSEEGFYVGVPSCPETPLTILLLIYYYYLITIVRRLLG
ncbi:hypothetical protein MITS9509_00424 [Synechococcus sp. MIT S9509]|nr:hypothetical protein MITS9504_00047 [Synechococcus sp. MIT S9504]KZR93131.1 hypothetical protein MITS9509_00424 [Synechococcus sp. MIT S9509]